MKNFKRSLISILLVNLFSLSAYAANDAQDTAPEGSPSAAAQPEATDYSKLLLGDWNGSRKTWEERGITNETSYKADIMGNVSGGVQTGVRALDNLNIGFNFDGEKLFGAKGLTMVVNFLNNNGGHADADLIASNQGIDNIEVPKATGKLYLAYIQQNLFDDKLSILAGLQDLNTEFYVNDPAGLFINSNFGIGAELSGSGVNGVSIFPFTTLGTRVRVSPTKDTYVQAAYFDGVPGDPGDLNGTQISVGGKDGAMMIAEAGYAPEGAKIAVGAWTFNKDFSNFITSNLESNQGFYVLGNREIYKESDGKGLAGFLTFGTANGAVSQFDYTWSGGFVYTGLIPGRDEGQLGLGVTEAHNSGDFRDAAVIAGSPVDDSETAIELTYSDKITPWFTIQPDVQYIVNPGTNIAEDNAFVIGSRFTIDF